MPRVSVIIPTYNRKDYVQEAIDSVLAQTYTDYEIIVVDDGSTDGTGEALQARYGDRIRYVWQENQGESVARNRGIEMARGKYVAFLDSDDLWLPEKLAKQLSSFEANSDIRWVICECTAIDAQGNDWPDASLSRDKLTPTALTLNELLQTSIIGLASMLVVERDLLISIGGFDTEIRYGEDWDLSIRLMLHSSLAEIAEPLCCIRYHRDSQCRLRTWNLIEPTLKDHLRIISKCLSDSLAKDKTIMKLKQRAEANEYTEAGLSALAWAEYQTGSMWLKHAADAIREGWITPSQLADRFTQLILEVQDRTAYYVPEQLRFVCTQIRKALSEANFSPADHKKFIEQFLVNIFFNAATRSDHAVMRWSLAHLLLIAPGWLRNPGIWSLGLESYLGSDFIFCLKRLVHRDRNSHAALY